MLDSEEIMLPLKGWDAMTDHEQACRLDRLIVWATIEMERFTFADVPPLLDELGVRAETSRIEGSLTRLELGFVLGKEAGAYFYRTPLFKKMILDDSPQAKLASARA